MVREAAAELMAKLKAAESTSAGSPPSKAKGTKRPLEDPESSQVTPKGALPSAKRPNTRASALYVFFFFSSGRTSQSDLCLLVDRPRRSLPGTPLSRTRSSIRVSDVSWLVVGGVHLLFLGRGSKDQQLGALRLVETKLHQLGVKHFGEDGSWESLGRAFQFLGGLIRTGTLSHESIDTWISNEAMYSKAAGKRKVGSKPDFSTDVSRGVQVGKSAALAGLSAAPVGSSSRTRRSSRSRSASFVPPSLTPRVVSSTLAQGRAPTVSVDVPVKASPKSFAVKPAVPELESSEEEAGPSRSEDPLFFPPSSSSDDDDGP